MERYWIREAAEGEQRELTRLCVRATRHAGYDDAFIERAMPALTISLPLISAGFVQLAEHPSGAIAGVVVVTTTALQGISLLHSLFVDPPFWRRGVGRMLFRAAVDRMRVLKTGALMIYAEPSAEGFYRRMGAVRIGEGPFAFSPDVTMPHFLYLLPREA
jgi:GNAT superfamily N-acetyltransferase